MISLITDNTAVEALLCKIEDSHCKRKIFSLYSAYKADFDFCEFYRLTDNSGGIAISCVLDKSDMIISKGLSDFDEAVAFSGGFRAVSSDEKNFPDSTELFEMNFTGCSKKSDNVCENPKLNTVYEVISSAFENIPFDKWYVDMSHRIRHGISKVFYLNGSAACAQFDIDGHVYVSQVSTLPQLRKKGLCTALLRHIASVYYDKTVYLHAESDMVEFYKKIGFDKSGSVLYSFG